MRAKIVAQKMAFDIGLGSAVLYDDDTVKEPTAGVIVVGHGRVTGLPKDAKGFMATALAEPKLMSARFAAARAVLANQAMVDPEWTRRLDPERARVMQLLKKVDHDLRE